MSIEKLQEQAHALFEYIKEVCLLGQQKILDVNKQMGVGSQALGATVDAD